MENLNVLLMIIVVSLAVGAALYEAFLRFTGKLKAKPFNPWTFPGHTNPPKPPPKDNWVRDGRKPPSVSKYGYSEEVMILQGPFKGVGRYDHSVEAWHCFFPKGAYKLLSTAGHRKEVEAWHKFPDYEKI